jgi:Zn-finger nucleic acid-binding protein
MFIGSKHCSHCGAKTVGAELTEAENAGACPRCQIRLEALTVKDVSLRECSRCGGLWSTAETFEGICRESEQQAAILNFTARTIAVNSSPQKISYVPCPVCRQLMNRSNFARSSGVIIDLCKLHGVWFDAEELPKIVEFIRGGGIETARQREKLELEEERNRLRAEQIRAGDHGNRLSLGEAAGNEPRFGSWIDFLFK